MYSESPLHTALLPGYWHKLQTESFDRSIAVLPFDNRSNREEDEFFTKGIHDDLLTTIAKIGSMKVISRTCVLEYKDTTKKIPETDHPRYLSPNSGCNNLTLRMINSWIR